MTVINYTDNVRMFKVEGKSMKLVIKTQTYQTDLVGWKERVNAALPLAYKTNLMGPLPQLRLGNLITLKGVT